MYKTQNIQLIGLSVGLLIVSALSLTFGSYDTTLSDLFGLLTGDASEPVKLVILTIRIPRILMSAAVGAALAVSGAALQGVFRNPLADPGLLGVSSGASMGAVTWLVFGSMWFSVATWSLPFAGFIGAIVCLSLVFKIANRRGQTDTGTLLLAGIAVNAFAGAYIGFAVYVADPNALRSFVVWSLGTMANSTLLESAILCTVVLVFGTFILRFANELNALMLGERDALNLGVDVTNVRRKIVWASAALVATAVSFSGLIGFVGLVVPHTLRLYGVADHRWVLPGSALGGATLMVVADLVARTLLSPGELPVGVLTALIGAPFFVFLLIRQRNSA